MNRRKMKIGSMMALKASFLVMVFSMGVIAPAIAQNKQNRKLRKKLKELLMMADSLRLQLRQSVDRGCMLQWGDSLLMTELGKSKMSEKKKQRFMKHYAKIQRRLSLYDRQLFRGDSLLQQGISSEQLAVVEAQSSLNLGIMLHEPLLFLLTHLTFTQFCHEKRVAPLEHTSPIDRLPQLESQAICHHQQFLQLLSKLPVLFILGDGRSNHSHRKYHYKK